MYGAVGAGRTARKTCGFGQHMLVFSSKSLVLLECGHVTGQRRRWNEKQHSRTVMVEPVYEES